jgi:Zn-dependent protease/CBS domain-containing protein
VTGAPDRTPNGSADRADRRTARPANRVRLGSVLGFEVDIDHSWFIIFFLVFWSLSQAIFPEAAPDLSSGTHVAMGFVGTVLFFASLLAHELSHALVSRSRSIEIEGITLYVFGGMARTSREPDTPRDEMLIAGVGPLSSLAIAGLFWMCSLLSSRVGAGPQIVEVADYLAVINLALAIFNMMPGFPLDGGRVFRAVAWGLTGDRTKATRWATQAGMWFGTLLMVLGAVQALAGAPLGGLWLAFIGWFLRSLARASFQQHVLHDLLEGFSASDLMTPDPQVIPASVPLGGLVDDRFLRLRYGGYPVLDGESLVGLVTLENVKDVPRREWASATVRDAMTPLSECAVVAPGAGVPEVLETMSHHPACGRVLVVAEGRLVGIISASDIARWMQRAQWMEHLGRSHRAAPLGPRVGRR